jgi:hypothetical protein
VSVRSAADTGTTFVLRVPVFSGGQHQNVGARA